MNKESVINPKQIENRIFNFRDTQVIVDRDLAQLYQVETKVLNQAVKRNIERFPKEFRFQLTNQEKDELVTNCDRFERMKHSSTNPFVFNEQGVAMLSAVLRSDVAVKVSIEIMNCFVAMRKIISYNSGLLQRLEGIERKQIDSEQKFEEIFKALEGKDLIPNQGVFFDGQMFDAYGLFSKVIRSAKHSIVLIDNYLDENTLTHLSKKKKDVNVILLSRNESMALRLDIRKANEQYGGFILKSFNLSHDRFLIIDKTEVFHLGASLKDLGKKWFAFSKMDNNSVSSLINSVSKMMS